MTYQIGQTVRFDYGRGLTGREIEPTWFALTVRSGRERVAHDALRARNIHSCYPSEERSWRVQGKIHRRTYPVIAGVVYAKFTAEPNWDVLRYRRIITGVYGRDGCPIAIPGDVIRAVMGLPTVAEELEAAQREMMRIRDGDRARFVTGPLSGMVVDVDRVQAGRVWFQTLAGHPVEARAEDMVRIA